MPFEIKVPDLGESVTEATIATWLKKPGEAVAIDEPIVELETDKATLEMPSPKAGVLTEIVSPEGTDVEVGAVIAKLEEGATATVAPSEPSDASASQPVKEPATQEAPATPPPSAAPKPVRTPAAPASEDDLDPTRLATKSGESVSLGDLMSLIGQGSAEALEKSGPAVRKLVEEHGLDPSTLPATGPGGRISKEDVQTALAAETGAGTGTRRTAGVSAAAPRQAAGARGEERVKMSRLRRTVAQRLKEAQNTAAILTTFNECDMSAVMAMRRTHQEAFVAQHGIKLGFMSFFTKAAVAALKAMPVVNGEIDDATQEVVYKHYYDIGIAVSTEEGLKVPVIRDCDVKSFAQIENELSELAGKARDGSLTLEEMQGGTFTISNGGVFGSLVSTPILNRPQSAILGLHKIQDRPVALNGEVVIRPMMYLAMSYDHRIIDGRESVTFLVKLKDAIENPERLLLDL